MVVTSSDALPKNDPLLEQRRIGAGHCQCPGSAERLDARMRLDEEEEENANEEEENEGDPGQGQDFDEKDMLQFQKSLLDLWEEECRIVQHIWNQS